MILVVSLTILSLYVGCRVIAAVEWKRAKLRSEAAYSYYNPRTDYQAYFPS